MATIINNEGLVTVSNNFTVQHQQAPYTEASMEVEYLWNAGVRQIAIAERPSAPANAPVACEIVQAHAPCGQLIIRWVARREGQMPYLPDPRSMSDNLTLASMQICSHPPKLMADGLTRSYKVWGTYVYILKQPVFVPSDGGWMGWSPVDIVAPYLNVISPSNFTRVF